MISALVVSAVLGSTPAQDLDARLYRGEWEQVLGGLRKQMAGAEAAKDAPAQARTAVLLARAQVTSNAYHLRDETLADEVSARAMDLAEKSNDPALIADASMARGRLLYFRAFQDHQWSASQDLFSRAQKLYAQVKPDTALLINSANMAIMLGVVLGAASLSDRVGRKPVMATAAIGMLLFAWPLMALMNTGNVPSVFLGQLGLTLLVGSYCAVNPIAICEIFPRNIRCSAVSTAYNITLGIVGGTAPIAATWLIDKTGYALAPAFYVMLAGAISTGATLSLNSAAQRRMEEPPVGIVATATSGR